MTRSNTSAINVLFIPATLRMQNWAAALAQQYPDIVVGYPIFYGERVSYSEPLQMGQALHAAVLDTTVINADPKSGSIEIDVGVLYSLIQREDFKLTLPLSVFVIAEDSPRFDYVVQQFHREAFPQNDAEMVTFYHVLPRQDGDSAKDAQLFGAELYSQFKPTAPDAPEQLEAARAAWKEALLEKPGFWDLTGLIDIFTGERYFSQEAYRVVSTALYDPKFRAHLASAKDVGLTIKAQLQTSPEEITLIIKPIELDKSVKDTRSLT